MQKASFGIVAKLHSDIQTLQQCADICAQQAVQIFLVQTWNIGAGADLFFLCIDRSGERDPNPNQRERRV